MAEIGPRSWTRRPTAGRLLSFVGASLAWTAAAVTGVIIAATLAAALVAAGVIGAAVVGVARLWPRSRPAQASDEVIEAHHVGGHSWVAYGFDRRV